MAYLLAFIATLVSSFVVEQFSKPKASSVFKRPLSALVISSFLVFCLFLLALLITQRPAFAACLSLLGITIVVVVNNTKFKTLREPLVFSDFFLYLQAIKHPRLYLPFLGAYPLIAICVMVLLIVFCGFYFESPAHDVISWATFGNLALLIVSVYSLMVIGRRVTINMRVNQDYPSLGVLAGLSCYGAQASDQRKSLKGIIKDQSPFKLHNTEEERKGASSLADIVVVQSESFFDARALSQKIKPTVLSEYDQCLSESMLHGKLKVPAWGANTMRTEFAFLCGLNPEALGLAQFYPYQQLMDVSLPSIVSDLKSQGYHCVCIHPNASSFFMRDQFFEKLGFDEFIDADAFTDAERAGPYVSDIAVSDKITEILSLNTQPYFVYTITMENHGPLHLESVQDNEWKDYFTEKPDKALTDLIVYLRHLKNADEMIKQQLEFYKARQRETIFAFYGDHVPAISHVFEALGYDDSRSNYFIWSSTSTESDHGTPRQMKAEALAESIANLTKTHRSPK
ncbi:LTA synthase family protein [Leucothrix sargassi]|nr:LTA synthase family protein [Leucothrix sargassi]